MVPNSELKKMEELKRSREAKAKELSFLSEEEVRIRKEFSATLGEDKTARVQSSLKWYRGRRE